MGIGSIPKVNRDYDKIRYALIERIPSITDKWTDYNSSDIGITILELFTGLCEELGFYLDNEAAESFIRYTLQRKNMIELVRLIGYRLKSVISASTTVTFTIPNARTFNVTIPKYTRLSTDGRTPVYFVTEEDATILAGDLTAITYRTLDHVLQYTNSTTFAITSGGDHTLKFPADARIKITIATGTFESTVVSSSYLAGVTSVVIADAIVNNSIEGVQYSSGDILIKEGSIETEVFTADGTSNFKITLNSKAIAEDSIEVIVDSETWTQKQTLIDSESDDTHYTWELDWENVFTLQFGDGVNGALIPNGTSIEVNYIVSSGSSGNVGASRITQVNSRIRDANNQDVTVSVSNTTAAVGGSSMEDIEWTRWQAPALAKAQDMGVTTEQFTALVKDIAGVGEARCYDIKDSEEVPFNVLFVYALPMGAVGGEQISAGMEAEIDAMLKNKAHTGIIWEIKNVTWVEIDLNVSVYVYDSILTPSYTQVNAKADISAAINEYLSIQTLGIGDNVTVAGLIGAINDAETPNEDKIVANVTLSNFTIDQVIGLGEMAMPGTVNITISGTI